MENSANEIFPTFIFNFYQKRAIYALAVDSLNYMDAPSIRQQILDKLKAARLVLLKMTDKFSFGSEHFKRRTVASNLCIVYQLRIKQSNRQTGNPGGLL